MKTSAWWRSLAALAASSLLAGCGLFATEPTSSHSIRNSPGAASSSSAGRPSYGETYVVARGDTLYSIAFRNQLDYHELADWNGIGRDYGIRVGQKLRLTPPDPTGFPPQASGASPGVASAATPSGASTSSPAQRAKPSSAATAASPTPGGTLASSSASVPAPRAVTVAGPSTWQWPTAGKLLRGFDGTANKGLDIGGDVGQTVVASRSGKVVYSGSALKGYGELIIVKHDEDTLSAYGYNRRRLVEEGDSVQAGQPIAELGLGPEQRPLLHFEIRDHGRPIDPKALLPSR